MKKMIILDGNSIMFRAYYATAYTGNLMQARNGLYTNAIYGFVNMINHIVTTPDMTNIFVAFDKGKKTLRHQAYADYKGGRKKTPEEFLMQIPYIKKYLDIRDIKHLELDDYEADDIVGSMAVKASPYFDEVMVVSGDKDLLQLAKGNIHVYLTKKGITDLQEFTEDNFPELMGFESKHMTDYKGLLGDLSDNLPGIPGIGEKTAIKLINEYGTVENLVEHRNELTGALKTKVENGYESGLKSKKLATLYLDVDLGINIEDTVYHEPKYEDLRSFYESVDFVSFIKKLDSSNKESNEEPEEKKEIKLDLNYHYNEIDKLKEDINNSDHLLIEVELTGENYHKEEVLGFGIVCGKEAHYIDAAYIKEVKDLLENSHIYTIDAKKLYCCLKKYDIELKYLDFDLLLSSYIVNPSYSTSDIKSIYDHFLATDLPFLDEIYGKKTIYQIPLETIYGKYAIDKASYLDLAKKEIDNILKEHDQISLYYDIELKLARVLGDMEIAGFKVNPKRLEEIGEEFNNKAKELEQEIYKLCGEEFNISSPKQLGVMLFEKLMIGKGKKNKTGYSTSAEELEKLALIHPVPRLVLEYRKYTKLYSTYVVGLTSEISKADGKVHTIFKQALTLTGRLSSTEPNIQNIPVRTEEGRLIRSAFVSSHDDGLLVSADYSQIELRVLSSLASAEHMITSFNAGEDLHASTASKIFGVPLDSVTKEQRRMAKAVNFGIVYGMSSWGLSEEIHISPQEASSFINRYFEIYPEIKDYLDNVVANTKRDGYTLTMFNRRRYIPEINSTNGALRQFGERTSKNAPIQGSAADIIKLAMIAVDKKLKENKLESKMIAQVHDELIIDTVKGEEEIVKKILKETMESVVNLKVKLSVSLATGTNWDMK